MVFFNWATMQMAAKIVYYGPGLCGKTTNLSYIYAKTAPGSRGEMVSLETETDRTLFFDLLPIEVGKVGGFRTRLQLYTVPGQVFYNTTRKLVLKGVDGVVFVADSQRPMADANVESLRNLEENLRELGIDLAAIPLVLQFNKRDLKNTQSVQELNQTLNPDGRWEAFEAVAVAGEGVFETLKAITKQTLKALRRRMVAQEAMAVAPPPPPAAAHPQVSFNPAGLSAAVAEGLAEESPQPPPDSVPHSGKPPGESALAVSEPPEEIEAPRSPSAFGEIEAPAEIGFAAEAEVATETEGAAVAVAEEEPLPEAEEIEEIEETEEAEEAPVEFDTTPVAPEVEVEAEMRHVKVASSLDILSELESLRKSSFPETERKPSAPSLDLDALLQGSLNSRQEVKRRVEQAVGGALAQASRCLVTVTLVDRGGRSVSELEPVEVELKPSSRTRELSLTLTFNLQAK